MINFIFKKFLCPKNIHKLFLRSIRIRPLDENHLNEDFPTRFAHVNECTYCGEQFECNPLPSYEKAPFEKVIIYGKDPFLFNIVDKI